MAKRLIKRNIPPGRCIYCGCMCYPGLNASDHVVKHRSRPPRYFHMECYNRFMAQEDQKDERTKNF